MNKNGSHLKSGLADPSRLSPFDEDDDEIFTVVIETPRGCRNKYVFDPDQKVFHAKKRSFPRAWHFLTILGLCLRQ